jgi:hypothetical protein
LGRNDSGRAGGDWDARTHVVPLTPVVPDRAIPTLPRTLVVAAIVGAIAFLAGLQLNPGRTPEMAVASAMPFASAPTEVPSPSGVQGQVIVRTWFQPGNVITATPGGSACVTDATTGSGVPSAIDRRVQTWLAQCPLKAGDQARFRDFLFQEFANSLNASSGWSVTNDQAGLSVAEIPFLDNGLPLTLVIAVRAIGDNLVIALTLAPTAT